MRPNESIMEMLCRLVRPVVDAGAQAEIDEYLNKQAEHAIRSAAQAIEREQRRAELRKGNLDACISTPIIDAAIKVAEQVVFDDSVKAGYYAFARILCPKEPPSEWIELMAGALAEFRGKPMWEYLPQGEVDKYRRDALAAYRAQPLYNELWGDEK